MNACSTSGPHVLLNCSRRNNHCSMYPSIYSVHFWERQDKLFTLCLSRIVPVRCLRSHRSKQLPRLICRKPFAAILCSHTGHLSICFPTGKFTSCAPSCKIYASSSSSDNPSLLRITRRRMVKWNDLIAPFWRRLALSVPKPAHIGTCSLTPSLMDTKTPSIGILEWFRTNSNCPNLPTTCHSQR